MSSCHKVLPSQNELCDGCSFDPGVNEHGEGGPEQAQVFLYLVSSDVRLDLPVDAQLDSHTCRLTLL